MQNAIAKDLIDFINSAPTPYATVTELKKRLKAAGGTEVKLSEINASLVEGCLYYTVFNDACIGAFIMGSTLSKGVSLAVSHTDCPVLRIKPNPTQGLQSNISRINVELYGGTIHHTWLDRPLKIAGRVCFESQDNENCIFYADIDVKDKTFVIPSAAIHVLPDVNNGTKFSIQNELLPFFSLGEPGDFMSFLSKETALALGLSSASILSDNILSFELSLLDACPASFSGAEDEMLSASGLDDKAMVHAIFTGLINASSAPKHCDNDNSLSPKIAFAFNHEECGSLSASGARSAFTTAFIKAICAATEGLDTVTDARFAEIMNDSFALSSDMAHAQHPAYTSKTDTQNAVFLGKGPVLKTSSNQSYSTSALSSAKFVSLCKSADIPYQIFANNSDVRGGSTIGPMISSALGIPTADIGTPMLAMHSARELSAAIDQEYAEKLFRKFFTI